MGKKKLDPSVLMGYLMIVGVFIVGAVLYGAFRYYDNQSAGALSVVSSLPTASPTPSIQTYASGYYNAQNQIVTYLKGQPGGTDFAKTVTSSCTIGSSTPVDFSYDDGVTQMATCADNLAAKSTSINVQSLRDFLCRIFPRLPWCHTPATPKVVIPRTPLPPHRYISGQDCVKWAKKPIEAGGGGGSKSACRTCCTLNTSDIDKGACTFVCNLTGEFEQP
jgi:hypothetical protein